MCILRHNYTVTQIFNYIALSGKIVVINYIDVLCEISNVFYTPMYQLYNSAPALYAKSPD